ncbi:MAG: efflux RND transporter periplasmic adaptor subunit [Hyphomicrobiaceae bacterium]
MLRLRCARLAGALMLAIAAAVGNTALAGPGHDHGHEPASAVVPASPRVVAISESYEFVGILQDGQITVFLDRMSDTSPVTAARLEMTVAGETSVAAPQPDGTYVFKSPVLEKHGDLEVIVAVQEGSSSDLLIGTLKQPAGHGSAHGELHDHAHADHHRDDPMRKSAGQRLATPQSGMPIGVEDLRHWLVEKSPLVSGFALAVGVIIGALVRRRAGVMMAIIGAFAVLGVGVAWAGPGHDHGEGGASASRGDAPRRLPDGELFLPKPTQRLLAIRTRLLSTETARSADRLIARVIANPNRSGLVQSTIGGRVLIAAEGLPTLGQKVRKGQVLAYIEPAFAPIDASDVRQTAGDLAQRISVLDARIARQQQLVERGVVNAASLQDLEIEREGLAARRKELTAARSEPEALVAPVDGVIAEIRVVAGQVVSAADTLFNVVDPTSLWVEAISFDPRIEPSGTMARARSPEGATFDLTYVGRSRALQQQATVLQFRLNAPSEALSIGSPVKVLIDKGGEITGLILPRSAIVQAPNGQMVAFKRLEPERYLPVAVRMTDLDGERVVVTAGLKAGDRIIVEGAPLVNQIR